ncbi:hypothetical protein PHJA_000042300 [Phtheirospermum japonicum]|uniref:Uncharacterized protein n=1 Tax=Phtheirospermum japonicum TaxID=374723 RepID=A0A830B247_9LAMI|nr:hypothetical protein PHJA_000042300 [Phtheirospermum japonicum]
MARHIVMILSKHQPLSIGRTGFGTCTFLLCALALFMCASHSRRWRRWKSCYGYGNHEPVIQLNQEEITATNLVMSTRALAAVMALCGGRIYSWEGNASFRTSRE